jgi:hypothetical protein
MSPSVQPISNPDRFSAATKRLRLRARSAMCSMPDVFEAVSWLSLP